MLKIDKAKELAGYLDKKSYTQSTKQKLEQMLNEIIQGGENDINLDIEDMKCVLSYGGKVYLGSAQYKGAISAEIAIELAMKDAEIKDNLLTDIMGALVCFTMHPDFSIMEIYEVMNVINENIHEDADIIFGTITDEALDKRSMKVHILFVADS
ncbi:hypothetical protein JHD46_02060 [Sulfurimonas sp. SAG-AH-194-C20]|nr:hypothetical protein [Sulfurimonas sp. SAG-AH-194-C20]MDF1878420.1 hypothetical protein [Sulfurimonas sp. SAG-AH-194-C20]